MPQRIAVILNPASGSATKPGPVRNTIRRAFPMAEILSGDGAGSARDAAREAALHGFEIIVAAGGDGTLNEVVNGVLEAPGFRPSLGLLPLGTGNDFARSVGIPETLEGSLNLLHSGTWGELDLVRVRLPSGAVRHYLNMSAGGFSGSVSEKTTGEVKATWGALSYLRGMVAALPELTPARCQVGMDGAPALELDLCNIVLANGRFIAGGIPIAPTASLTDGLLDLVGVRAISLPRLAILAPQILGGEHLDHESIFFRRGRTISVSSVPAMSFNADGELLGETPLVFEVLPRAVRFIVGVEPRE